MSKFANLVNALAAIFFLVGIIAVAWFFVQARGAAGQCTSDPLSYAVAKYNEATKSSVMLSVSSDRPKFVPFFVDSEGYHLYGSSEETTKEELNWSGITLMPIE